MVRRDDSSGQRGFERPRRRGPSGNPADRVLDAACCGDPEEPASQCRRSMPKPRPTIGFGRTVFSRRRSPKPIPRSPMPSLSSSAASATRSSSSRPKTSSRAPCSRRRDRCSPTNMPKVIRAAAIMAAASSSTSSNGWRSSGSPGCSAAVSPTSRRIPAARPIRRCFSPCCSRAIRSWGSISPPAAI